MFRIGDSYKPFQTKPSFATITRKGDNPTNMDVLLELSHVCELLPPNLQITISITISDQPNTLSILQVVAQKRTGFCRVFPSCSVS